MCRLDVSDSEVRERIRNELEETQRQLHALLGSLSAADWDAPSRNPAWTNGQLIFHMLFAFMLVPSLFWAIRLHHTRVQVSLTMHLVPNRITAAEEPGTL